MPWYVIDLDNTLVTKQMDEVSGQETSLPIDGAVEAMHQLTQEGNRLTVFTSRFAPMPLERKHQLKEEIEQELAELGFPPMEVWTGTTRPAADIFIGSDNVTFDGDWGLALAQSETMLQERGLLDIPPDNGAMEAMETVSQEEPVPNMLPQVE